LNTVKFSALVRKGEKQYVALCPELDVVSQGPTIDEAIKNLEEAVELYLEDSPPQKASEKIFITQIEVKHEAASPVGA